MKDLLSMLFMMIVLVHTCAACTFLPDSFCQTANSQVEATILSGVISSVDSDGINFEVLSVVRGIESRTNIRIWDGTDFDCNGPFSMAASDFGDVGDTLVVILPLIDEIENDWDVIGDYRRPDTYTSTPVLHVIDGVAYGLIQGDAIAPPEFNLLSFPLEELVQFYSQDQDCSQITEVKDIDYSFGIKAYPNPTTGTITIALDVPSAQTELRIYDALGSLVEFRILSAKMTNVELGHLAPAVYTAIIFVGGEPLAMTRVVRS